MSAYAIDPSNGTLTPMSPLQTVRMDVFDPTGRFAYGTGSNSDSLIALNPATSQWTYFRVPYPLGFYSRGMDARIDDANAGWKGRGLWSTSGDRVPCMMEGGKGSKPRAVHIQIRPDPLAK